MVKSLYHVSVRGHSHKLLLLENIKNVQSEINSFKNYNKSE